MIREHSEEQYLELETNFMNLFNSVQSLLTITEGENLDSDTAKLNHFKALCKRINSISNRFQKAYDKTVNDMYNGDRDKIENTPKHHAFLNQKEYDMLLECIDHFIQMYGVVENEIPYKDLRNKITNQSESK